VNDKLIPSKDLQNLLSDLGCG